MMFIVNRATGSLHQAETSDIAMHERLSIVKQVRESDLIRLTTI